ncbi:MAG: hypothetical protein QXZ30_02130 [Candidatus Bilamarchaeaceae archaeon]
MRRKKVIKTKKQEQTKNNLERPEWFEKLVIEPLQEELKEAKEAYKKTDNDTLKVLYLAEIRQCERRLKQAIENPSLEPYPEKLLEPVTDDLTLAIEEYEKIKKGKKS